jgi:nitroreductase
MTDTSITSANSVLTLVVGGLFPAPVQMKGYASDKAFVTEALELAEVNMGVDGRMTAGFTPNPVKQTITLQADSPSKAFFAAIIAAMKTSREIFWLSGDLTLPATGESFSLTRGILSAGKQIPDAQKVLQAMDFVITWESVNASLL